MPHFLQNPHDEDIQDDSQSPGQSFPGKHNMWGRTWHKVGSWLKKEEEHRQTAAAAAREISEKIAEVRRDGNGRNANEVVPTLPRPITSRRKDSERRERLVPHEPDAQERRACSADRRRANSVLREPSTATVPLRPSMSLPNPHILHAPTSASLPAAASSGKPNLRIDTEQHGKLQPPFESPIELYPSAPSRGAPSDPDLVSEGFDDQQLQNEIDSKWILNLSMHFRDKSDREKFFVTYAREPNKWLRVTVSLDYREMQQDSLEYDLKGLHYQRDKSARIYEAIRDSLPGIQFYPSVTNLKLQTRDGRLHVHVTEDVNEIIKYPSVSLVNHVPGPRIKESEIEFDSHLSGFVYKIRTSLNPSGHQKLYIKKEIPGPDSVDEFLYEINALSTLRGSPHVIEFKAIVTSDDEELIKGLLIAYAPGGTLIDHLFDHRQDTLYPHSSHTLLGLERRLRYARQILRGLNTIHSSGFVQGDFTLSNIVLDTHDNARIIDINRRGCPVGWEPPELEPIIQSHGRVGMFIGVKSDIWQCGMVLWALGRGIDEPERADDVGEWDSEEQVEAEEVPEWYKKIVEGALQRDPRDRMSTAELLALFPKDWEERYPPRRMGDREYIDPNLAVSHEDIAMGRSSRSPVRRSHSRRSGFSTSDLTFADEVATSTEYLFDSSGSYVVGQRGEERSHQPTSDTDATVPVVSERPIHDGGDEDVKKTEEGTAAGVDNNDRERYERKSAEDILASRISTGVPASLLTQKLQALAHIDSGFDEPRGTPVQ